MTFRRLRNLLAIAGVILALVPSLTIGLGIVSIPPEMEARFAYVAGVVGLLVFFVVVVARTALLRLKRPVLIALFAGCTVSGLFVAGRLAEFTDASMRSLDVGTGKEARNIPYILPEPESYSPELRTLIEGKYRGSINAAIKAERTRVLELMARDSVPVQWKMLILLAVAHALILFGILLGAFAGVKVAGRNADELLK